MAQLRLLIDNNVAAAVASFFREQGDEVYLARELLGQLAVDEVVAATALDLGLMVVTHDKDFRRFSQLLPVGRRNAFAAGAGCISLQCREEHAVARLTAEIEGIRFYHDLAKSERARLFVAVTERGVRFHRATSLSRPSFS